MKCVRVPDILAMMHVLFLPSYQLTVPILAGIPHSLFGVFLLIILSLMVICIRSINNSDFLVLWDMI